MRATSRSRQLSHYLFVTSDLLLTALPTPRSNRNGQFKAYEILCTNLTACFVHQITRASIVQRHRDRPPGWKSCAHGPGGCKALKVKLMRSRQRGFGFRRVDVVCHRRQSSAHWTSTSDIRRPILSNPNPLSTMLSRRDRIFAKSSKPAQSLQGNTMMIDQYGNSSTKPVRGRTSLQGAKVRSFGGLRIGDDVNWASGELVRMPSLPTFRSPNFR